MYNILKRIQINQMFWRDCPEFALQSPIPTSTSVRTAPTIQNTQKDIFGKFHHICHTVKQN